MDNRIYVVTNKATGEARLVSAPNPSQALKHVTAQAFATHAATPTDVARLMSQGVQVESIEAAKAIEAASVSSAADSASVSVSSGTTAAPSFA